MRPIDPSRVQDNVGRRIAELRQKQGLSQAELAEHAEVSLKYIQRVEGGGANLTISSLVGFANVLGTRVNELFRAAKTRARKPGRPKIQTHR